MQVDHTAFFGGCMPVVSFKIYMLNMRKEQSSQKPLPFFSRSVLLTYVIQVGITSSYYFYIQNLVLSDLDNISVLINNINICIISFVT